MNNNEKRTAPERLATPQRSSSRRRRKKQSKALYYLLLVVLLGILIFSAVKIISYLSDKAHSEQTQQDVIDNYVTPGDDTAAPEGSTDADKDEEKEPEPPKEPEPETISVDFASLRAKYPDVVAWIYGADTGLNYPIVKSKDNNDYLYHDLDGKENNNGTIFIDCKCGSDFSSANTLIYGHNMKTGRMFAPITNYKNSSYYSAHPYLYIYTPSQNYRLDLFAGFSCPGDYEVYSTSLSQSQLQNFASKSTFKSNIGVPTGKVVTLSTCSYEQDNYRYVLIGSLVPIS